jgi:hypothetical protein
MAAVNRQSSIENGPTAKLAKAANPDSELLHSDFWYLTSDLVWPSPTALRLGSL